MIYNKIDVENIPLKEIMRQLKGGGIPTLDVIEEAKQGRPLKKGRKDSSGKLDWSLLPFKPLKEVVRVMEDGKKKYGGKQTWYPGIKFSKLFAAIMRHLIWWYISKKDKDRESGYHPLCHVIANCLMLLTFINDKEWDDR